MDSFEVDRIGHITKREWNAITYKLWDKSKPMDKCGIELTKPLEFLCSKSWQREEKKHVAQNSIKFCHSGKYVNECAKGKNIHTQTNRRNEITLFAELLTFDGRLIFMHASGFVFRSIEKYTPISGSWTQHHHNVSLLVHNKVLMCDYKILYGHISVSPEITMNILSAVDLTDDDHRQEREREREHKKNRKRVEPKNWQPVVKILCI